MNAHNTNALIVDKDAGVLEIVNSAHLMMISVTEMLSRMPDTIENLGNQKVMFGALYLSESVEKLLEEASTALEWQDLQQRKQQGAQAHALDDLARASSIARGAQGRLAVLERFAKAIAEHGDIYDIPSLKRMAVVALATSAEAE